jgi:hypothetical protein
MRNKVKSFMKYLINKKSTEVDKEYLDLLSKYRKMFGKNVPTECLPSRITEEQIKQAMKECIETGQDSLLDILGVSIDDTVLY